MKEFCRLSEFERGDFYSLSNKIVLNQTIHKKDFSEFFIRQVNFSNCIFDWTSFPCTKCEDLTFERCILQNASFKKSELENCIFKNCQLTNINFARSDLMDFDFINCKLENVDFSAGELMDLKFYNSQLQDVYFLGSLLDNVKIKHSTLETIRFDGSEVYKEIYKNGELIAIRTPINDYASFLIASDPLLLEGSVMFEYKDDKVLKQVMIFFTIVTSIAYCLLKPDILELLLS